MAEPKDGGQTQLPGAPALGTAPAAQAWPDVKVQIPVLPALAPELSAPPEEQEDQEQEQYQKPKPCPNCGSYH